MRRPPRLCIKKQPWNTTNNLKTQCFCKHLSIPREVSTYRDPCLAASLSLGWPSCLLIVCHGMSFHIMRYHRKSYWISWHIIGYRGISWNLIGQYHEISWDAVGYHGRTSWDTMGCHGISWKVIRPHKMADHERHWISQATTASLG